MKSVCFPCVFVFALAASLPAQVPEWIWHDNKGAAPADREVRFFRKTFTVEGQIRKAELTASGDDNLIAFLNGKQVLASKEWNKAVTADVTTALKPGENVLAIRGQNNSGDAAVIARLDIAISPRRRQTIITDTSWLSSSKESAGWQNAGFTAADWAKPVSRGRLGVMPWGDVMAAAKAARAATPAEQLTTLPGFKIELLHSATAEEGSWICMAIDPKGRLIISPQGDRQPLLRVTLSKQGKVERIERVNLPVWTAMGLLYAFDSLYVSGNGSNGLGLYRLRDTDRDDQYDKVEFLKKFDGAAGEHGSHALVLGPDQKIYYIHGNFVKVPGDISPTSPHRNFADDLLLGRMEDGNGFGAGNKPPGSFILRMDADAKNCELFAAGMRNAYDFDFSPEGEMFTFDSDMEWDWGTPWYRPTRVYHVVSGGDYGFREGTGKWPGYYPDDLPPTVDIGIGSPTGVKFGTKSAFPTKYKRALYIMDWSYGRILAVHLTPKGASYIATFENLVAPASLNTPGPKSTLNVTDMEFGHDGALYFTTGGRGTQSGLYRVSYTEKFAAEKLAVDRQSAEARELRHKLESFHGKRDPAAVDFAWPNLKSDDRWIRYAARIAIESQPVEQWQARASEERNVNASLNALLALARCGPKDTQDALMESLGKAWDQSETEEQKLEAVRVAEVCFARMGRPNQEVADGTIRALEPLYGSSGERLNREICQVLIYLDAPGVVQKTMDLFAKAQTQEDQLYYLFYSRLAKTGWTLDQRKAWFSWFQRERSQDKHPPAVLQWFKDGGRDYGDGASFPKFMAKIAGDGAATLNASERADLRLSVEQLMEKLVEKKRPSTKPGPQRQFVREWKMNDLLPVLDQAGRGRSFDRGKEAFAAAQCLACHRFGNEGGSVGSDITAVSSRFTRRDVLESILDPSKVISEQYQNLTVTRKNDEEVTGRLVEETEQKLVLVPDQLTGVKVEVARKDVQKRAASKISPMPEGLLNTLTKDEILDLLAYIESGGKREHAAFQSSK